MEKILLLEEGDIIELKPGHRVYANVPQCLIYDNRPGDWSLGYSDIVIGGLFSYLAGKYVVCKISFDGGGHDFDGDIPNGHHVYCEKAGDVSCKVDFYQTGGFTAMIKNIKPIGKATRRWEWPGEHGATESTTINLKDEEIVPPTEIRERYKRFADEEENSGIPSKEPESKPGTINYNTGTVETDKPSASPEENEQQNSKPLENPLERQAGNDV